MYSMGVLVLLVVDGHKPGMYSLGVLVVVDGHESDSGRMACLLTFLAAREGLQHVWVHAYLPCLQRMPTQKLWIAPGCIQAERS